MRILETAVAIEGQGAVEPITGRPGFYRLKPPPRWEGLARQTLAVGSRTDRMEIVFDATWLKTIALADLCFACKSTRS